MYMPLTNNPEETFNLSIYDIVYRFKQLWNQYGFWTLDISDNDGNILVYGVKIITREYILQQFPHIPFDLLGVDDLDPTRYTLESFKLGISEKYV